MRADGKGTTRRSADRQQVAVIGAGVAGLTAAYLLQRAYDVTLFEADDRLGGHAHTQEVLRPSGELMAVDTGFIVHNRRTYPNLLRLFNELEVDTQDSEMSMSVRCEGCGLEYAGARQLQGLFSRPANAASPRFLLMLAEVKRFHRQARALLDSTRSGDDDHALTLGEFLTQGRYSRYFTDHFMLPLVSAVWSTGPDVSSQQPARSLFEFFDNHGMLSVKGSPQWRTVVGGSRSYVDRVAKQLTVVRQGTPVRALARDAEGFEVRTDDDRPRRFAKVVVATHSDQALALLASPTSAEHELLSRIGYTDSEAWLHTDTSVLPRRSGAASSWNYLKAACTETHRDVLVSYDMNRLMRLPGDPRVVVTLNGRGRVDEGQVLNRMRYMHPVFTTEAVAARDRLPALNDGAIAFAGAYHGWGFHEDGCASGVRAAASLGVSW